MNKRQALSRLRGYAALSGLLLLGACTPQTPSFQSIDITGADYAKDFSLPDQNGRQRTMADFKGSIVVLFFGFTQCPDVCPTALTELTEVRRQLEADGARMQVLFVTVDPERDSAEVLKAYMGNFDPSFVALIPTPSQLESLAKDFKLYYKKSPGKTPGSYSMDHSAGSFVYDSAGRVRLYTRGDGSSTALLSDIRLLLKQS
jgi:protein SCO1/2